jgi:hypothetical protein
VSPLLVRRLAGAVAWTAVLAASVYAADRFILGPRVAGWREAPSVDALTEAVATVTLPAYVPETLAWPPAHLLMRTGDAPGWWLGLVDRGGGSQVRVWLGSGEGPLPDALADVAGCVSADSLARCPPAWHALSGERAGRTVWVVGRVDAQTLRRVLASTHGP